MTFVFKLNDPDLRRIIDHTVKNPVCKTPYQQKPCETSLNLVKDWGAYIMSGSDEPFFVDDTKKNQVCVYAQGCKPEDGHIGGDDFVECLPLKMFTDAIAQKRTTAIIVLTEDKMDIEFT